MGDWASELAGKFGFGCMRLPMVGDEPDYATCSQMFDYFLESGFTYFDTAKVYLGGKSEVALRRCLVERHGRGEYLLTDKLSTSTFTREDQIDAVLQSELDALGVEYLDTLLMHAQNAKIYEKYQRLHAYEHGQAFVAAGKARHLGISFHDSPEVLDRILTEHPEVEVVQIQLNYADWENPSVRSRQVYEVCVRHGKPCIVMEPVKGGSLVNLPERAQAQVDSMPNPEGLDNAGIALRFAASMPEVKMVLSGMGSMEMVRSNCRSMASTVPFSDEQMSHLLGVHQVFTELGMVECTACHYCVDGCPRHIRIPEIFGALNSARVFGGWNPGYYYSSTLVDEDHGRASDCIKCGRCELSCPQKLPIRQLLVEAAAEFDQKA